MAGNLPAVRAKAPPARQSRPPATRANATVQGGATPPRTEYVYVSDKGGGQQAGGYRYTGDGSDGFWKRYAMRMAGRPLQNKPVPHGVPRWLGNPKLIGYAWLTSMILIGFDEWHHNGILPRPPRLWWTSVVFGVLALAAMIDAFVPIANVFAVGYTLVLYYQYYNNQGQFS